MERGPGGAAAAVFGATSEDPTEAPLFPSLGKSLASPALYSSFLFRFATLPLLAPFAGVSPAIAEAMYLSRFMLPDVLRRLGALSTFVISARATLRRLFDIFA